MSDTRGKLESAGLRSHRFAPGSWERLRRSQPAGMWRLM